MSNVQVITTKGYTTVVHTENGPIVRATSLGKETRVLVNNALPMPVAVPGRDGEPIKAMTIENVTASEDLTFFYSHTAQTIAKVRAVVDNPQVTYNIFFGSDRSAPGTPVTTTPVAVTDNTVGQEAVIDNAEIPAGSWVWLVTTAKSGAVKYLNVTIEFEPNT